MEPPIQEYNTTELQTLGINSRGRLTYPWPLANSWRHLISLTKMNQYLHLVVIPVFLPSSKESKRNNNLDIHYNAWIYKLSLSINWELMAIAIFNTISS